MALLDSFFRVMVDQRASDLHLHAGKPPLLRLDGDLVALPFRVLHAADVRRFLDEILSEDQRTRFATEKQVDLLYELRGVGRFRSNCFAQLDGPSAVFRVIPEAVPTLSGLGMPRAVRQLALLQSGLVLVCGPTGSGKSTTLAAMVHEVASTSPRHVITLEDPIEFVHEPTMGVVTQREVGRDVASFSAGLRSALRESPDVLMVGELRDAETVGLALQAAETGVLVLATLHTNSAAKAVDRVVDAVPEGAREQARASLSVLLRGVVAQQLAKRASGEGRVAALEVLVGDTAVANLIRTGKVHLIEATLQSASTERTGNQGMDNCLFGYVRDGTVEPEEAIRLANLPELLRQRIATIAGEE
jgi:twitching motility protein PilT